MLKQKLNFLLCRYTVVQALCTTLTLARECGISRTDDMVCKLGNL